MKHEIPELDSKGLRQFGLMAAVFFIAVFGLLLPWLASSKLPFWPWVIGLIFTAWALIAPATMKGFYKGWMIIAMLIGSVLNKVILSVAFYLVLFPMGLVLRLLGKTPLQCMPDKSMETYRIISKLDKKEKMEKPF